MDCDFVATQAGVLSGLSRRGRSNLCLMGLGWRTRRPRPGTRQMPVCRRHRTGIAQLDPAFLALIASRSSSSPTRRSSSPRTAPLAGLGLASAVLLTAVGLFVFLAYRTHVRRRPADRRGLAAGRDPGRGWTDLARHRPLARCVREFAFAAIPYAARSAATDRRWECGELPAGGGVRHTGDARRHGDHRVLRGLQDTVARWPPTPSGRWRTPDEPLFVYGFHWG